MREQEITIAEILKSEGYQTFFAGKWHMGHFFQLDGAIPTPGDHGFDRWTVRSQQKITVSGVTRAKDEFLTEKGAVPYRDGGSCDEVVAQSIRLLRDRDPGKPFFIEICSREPHTPLTPPESFRERYDNDRVRRLEKFIQYGRVPRPSHVDNQPELHPYYYGTVTQLDAAFGKLMDALEEMGMSDNTLVFFTSDNGPEFPQTGWPETYRSWGSPGEFRGMKRHLYEGGTRVPGIVRWTGHVEPGRVSDELISATDLLPTICDLLDIKTPEDRKLDGTSFAPVLYGEPFERTQPLFWNICYIHAPQMAMRLGGYVLLGYFDPIGPEEPMQDWIKEASLEGFELYNLENDPRQEVDLKYKESELFILFSEKMKSVLAEIQEESPTWPNQTGGTLPINVSFQMGIPGSDIK
jgi:arylsulfatase A